MHAKGIVGLMLKDCLSSLHEKRAEAVRAGVGAALRGGHLSLSGLAQRMAGTVALRYRVKRMDRLLGNDAIHGERAMIYGALARGWLRQLEHVLVVVDWSDVTADQRWHLLRASVAVDGRSVTLYEEVHPRRRLANRWVHQRFLATLARLLPAGCQPIIMTDAGFRSPWFAAVSRRQWPWVGRVRNRDMISMDGNTWHKAKELYGLAHERPIAFDDVWHVRSHPMRRHFVLVKESAKGRVHRTRLGEQCRSKRSLQSACREREPWLLACAPDLAHLSPSAIVALYTQRMSIEESFRDTKSAHYGMGLRETRSRSAGRLELLLMIGHLAAWILRLIGESAQQCQLALRFQSTGRSLRREISVITLATRAIREPMPWLTTTGLRLALERLRSQALEACRAT